MPILPIVALMTTSTLEPLTALARGPAEQQVTADILGFRTIIVNLYLVGTPGQGGSWVLIDAGIPGYADQIIDLAERRFGRGTRPSAIILTHGHFDHRGSLPELLQHWDVPVYAHHMEMPYLTGQADYPPPDPTVGGGLMARSALLFPRRGIDLQGRVHPLPEDRTVPGMPGWRWIYTPGHSPGHVSLFREEDRALIAGDAFVATKQESLISVLTQHQKLHGPPGYFTIDWDAARDSVQQLARLHPAIAATGHGIPMSGQRLNDELSRLAANFDQVARPGYGRYIDRPTIYNEQGVVWVPPPVPDPLPMMAAVAGLTALTAVVVARAETRRHR